MFQLNTNIIPNAAISLHEVCLSNTQQVGIFNLNNMKKNDPHYSYYREIAVFALKQGNTSLSKVAKMLKHDRATVTKWAKEEGLIFPVSSKRPINSSAFKTIDTEEKAYWLGFLYADGYVSDENHIELSLKLMDEYHVVAFNDFLSIKGHIYKDNFRARCRFKDMEIGNDLKKLGCHPRKSLTLKFPSESQVPFGLLNHFIRGYYDGDGSIGDPSKNPINVSLIGTHDFLCNVLCAVGIETKVKVKNCKGSPYVFMFQITGDNCRNFLSFIYKDSTLFLKRKEERYRRHLIRFYLNKKNGNSFKKQSSRAN